MSHDKLTLPVLRLAAVSSLMLLSAQAWATCSTDPYIGSVCYTAANFCPAPDYLPADGRTLNVSGYQALYSLLGNIYGGTAPATFALPDLRVRTVVGTGKQPATNITMQLGQTRGQEATVLNPAQVPLVSHTHALGSTTTQAISASATANLPVTVTVPAQAISVNGKLQIANDTASGQGTVTAGAILAKGGGQASIYAPASTTQANTDIGPTQTFQGTTSSQQANGTAQGQFNFAFQLPQNLSVAPAGQAASQAVSLINPQIGLTACIATAGTYPMRP